VIEPSRAPARQSGASLIAVFIAVQVLSGLVYAWSVVRWGERGELGTWGFVGQCVRFLTPGATAVLLIGWSEGAQGLRELGGRFLRWGGGWRMAAAALALPTVVLLAGAVGYFLDTPRGRDLAPPMHTRVHLQVAFLSLGSFLGVEPGLRGFLQERVRALRHPLRWAVGIGLVGACWNGQVFVSGFRLEWLGALGLTLLQVGLAVWFAWIYLRSDGSLLVSGLAAAVGGLAIPGGALVVFGGLGGPASVTAYFIAAALFALVLLVRETIVVARRERRQAKASPA